MGFDNVGNLTHEMENLLQSLKEQKYISTPILSMYYLSPLISGELY